MPLSGLAPLAPRSGVAIESALWLGGDRRIVYGGQWTRVSASTLDLGCMKRAAGNRGERHTARRCGARGTTRCVEEVIEGAQNHIVLCATLRGQRVESAARFKERVFAVASLRDGQVVRRESYSTRNEALEAAGPRR